MKNESTTESANLTLAQMEILCNEAFDLKEQIKALEAQTSDLNKTLTKLKSTIITAMEAAELTRFASERGRIELVETYNASLPDNPDDRKVLFEQMKAKYGEEFMTSKLTMYAKSVESLVRAEMEEAAENGVILNEFFGLPIKESKYIKLV